MKIRKNAEQQNFFVDVDYYTKNRETWEEFEHLKEDYYIKKLDFKYIKEDVYVVYTDECEEVKVKYLDGEYKAVAKTKAGLEIVVTL